MDIISNFKYVSPLALAIDKTGVKEKYENTNNDNTKTENMDPLEIILNLSIFVVAAYLSWTCNTKRDVSTPLKVIYALFAGVFGFVYIIIHMILVGGNCCKCN